MGCVMSWIWVEQSLFPIAIRSEPKQTGPHLPPECIPCFLSTSLFKGLLVEMYTSHEKGPHFQQLGSGLERGMKFQPSLVQDIRAAGGMHRWWTATEEEEESSDSSSGQHAFRASVYSSRHPSRAAVLKFCRPGPTF